VSEQPKEDWAAVVEDVIRGNQVAFVKLSRLVTGFLARFHSFDLRDDWPDIVQEVVLATIEAKRRQSIRDPNAVYGYVRSATRFKFIDRLRIRQREAIDGDPSELPERPAADAKLEATLNADVWEAVEQLPENQRIAVVKVFAEGMTYEEAAESTGIPLGSLKRYLRLGLAAIHAALKVEPV
jgi:RNA polymerase sigma-70 factor, ECF subfamily